MEVKILGMGCKKCGELYNKVNAALAGREDVKVEKIEDIKLIMQYKVMSTPALVVDGKVVFSGRIPSDKELRDVLAAG